MENVNANELILHLQKKVEKSIQLSIKLLQPLSSETLLRKASEDKWSATECLEHLNTYSRFYLPLIQSIIEKSTSSPVVEFKSGWLGKYFTNMMDVSSTKKYTAFKKHLPPSTLNPQSVIKEFITHQEHLLILLNLAKQCDLNVKVPISISKLIKLKLGDVFQFIIAHDERHISQAQKAIQ